MASTEAVYTVDVRGFAFEYVAKADGHHAVGPSPSVAVLRLAGKLGIPNGCCRIGRMQQLGGGASAWEIAHVPAA